MTDQAPDATVCATCGQPQDAPMHAMTHRVHHPFREPVTETTPRTEAGRALLDAEATTATRAGIPWTLLEDAILAIETEATRTVLEDIAERHGPIRAAITNAYYEARNNGWTMETAADNAAAAVLALFSDRETK